MYYNLLIVSINSTPQTMSDVNLRWRSNFSGQSKISLYQSIDYVDSKISWKPYIVDYLVGDSTWLFHYNDVIMDSMASQITSLTIVYSAVYSGADQRKHQSSASLVLVRGIHRGTVNSPHKWPGTRKMFPFDDAIMSVAHDYIWLADAKKALLWIAVMTTPILLTSRPLSVMSSRLSVRSTGPKWELCLIPDM